MVRVVRVVRLVRLAWMVRLARLERLVRPTVTPTWSGLRPVVQWAAVRTWLEEIRAPPQN